MGGASRSGVMAFAVAGLAVVALPAATARTAPGGVAGSPLDGTPLCGVESPAGDAAPVPDDGVLRVATFNVLHSLTDDGDVSLGERIPLLADELAGSGADIVGAQEVTRNVTYDATAEAPQKHGLVAPRLAAAIAARTGVSWQWCWSLSNPHVPLTPDLAPGGGNPLDTQAAAMGNFPDPGDFSEGLAILTRFELGANRFRRLPPRSFEAPGCTSGDPFCPFDALFDSRQVLWARVVTPDGGVDMFTTHLAHTLTALSDTTRLLQVREALAITAEWSADDELPDFLVGDFNSTPDSAVMAATEDAGFVDTYGASGAPDCDDPGDLGCSGGPTDGKEVFSATPDRAMSERIDYVLARPPAGCTLEVTDSRVLGAESTPRTDGRFMWPSDHLGFVSATACSSAEPSAPAPPAALDAAAGGGRLPATGGRDPGPWPVLAAAVGLTVASATGRARS